MKLLCKNPIVALLVVFVVFMGIGLVGPIAAQAATTPDLGVATTYGVLADTFNNTSVTTTINGDIGFTTFAGAAPGGINANYTPAAAAGAAQAAALIALNSAPNLACDVTFAAGAIDLGIDHAPEHVGTTYTPGVYCITGAMSIDTSPITLNGAGTYIFRSTGAFTTSAGMTVTLTGGASACDVFWNPTGSTTIGANNFFEGTVIPTISGASDITVNDSTLWHGRALTFSQVITLPDTNVTIDVPVCTGTINVSKVVVGGSLLPAAFPLAVNGSLVVTGATNIFAPGTYTITETSQSNYTGVYSGDCVGGTVNLLAGDTALCFVTNTYTAPTGGGGYEIIPPLIDVLKVPSPLALPAGPGSVTYTYTVTNPGTVPLDDVTLVGDSCSPIALISGDTNSDSRLQPTETWVYTCATTLTATHTNVVVASGSANGITAIDTATATVIVGLPIVPPFIHITKVPSPLALSVGGGMVTYTKKVTNPGTVPLSNVTVIDDKCSPVTYISGDSNSDSNLDPTETWTYTCSMNLTQTTTNTASASGEANGITARDLALATVVVPVAVPPVPALPNTGFPAQSNSGIIVLTGLFIAASISLYIYRKKLTN